MEAKPLKELDDVLNWKASLMDHYLRSHLTYRDKFSKVEGTPDVLVCHDFYGGYFEDSCRLGISKSDVYKFWNWWKVDIFVYFSHHLVTIPPSSWIDAAHRHGVKILGTFITEWDDGAKTCSKLLEPESLKKDESPWKKCADQLIEISSFFGFDGWLINIENALKPFEADEMVLFVKYLTEGQKAKVEGSMVLWYDSVTSNGELAWQNELNARNESFCEACDGIFLNYGWNKKLLNSTADFCNHRNVRKTKVFIGCDVYGSECHVIDDYKPSRELNDPGIRKRADLMSTQQCLEMCSGEHEMSFAIFAPGWTHEALGAENFVENETRFWNKLKIPSKRKITMLPIVTSFCQGSGNFYCFKGKTLNTNSWSNMSLQTLQPLSCAFLSNCTDDSFVGGGCLKVSCQKLALHELFDVDINFSHVHNKSFTVRWFSKCRPHTRMAVIVVLDDANKTDRTECHLLFNRGSKPHPDDGGFVLGKEHGVTEVHELPPEEGLPTNSESDLPWVESCHTIHNVHGKSLRGLHLLVAKDENAPNSDDVTSYDLLLGYLELFISDEEKTQIPNTTFLESFATCEISIHLSNGDLRISKSSTSEFLHSFMLVRFEEKKQMSSFEIKTLNDLVDAIHTNSDEPLQGPSGVYLRWRAGHGEDPCDGQVMRFHAFVGNACETSKVFCTSPTPILELDLKLLGQAISEHVLDLSIKIECFVF